MTVLKDCASCIRETCDARFAIVFASRTNDKTFAAIARSFLCEGERKPCYTAHLGIALDVSGHRCRTRASNREGRCKTV